jgi:hypothetical protein
MARGTGTTHGHVAVPLIAIAGSLIGTSRRVQASMSWSEPMTLWAAMIGHSGSGKTPGMGASVKPLDRVERSRENSTAALQREHDQRVALAAAVTANWNAEVKKATKEKRTPPPKPSAADRPEAFIPPRLYVKDATIERITVLLQAHPQGMLLVADELAGWFHNMSRYTGRRDNQFWLIAWDGSSYVVERMNRPAITLERLLIGVVGGLQPDKLADVFKGAADGMYARFLFAWPPTPSYHPLSNAIAEIDPDIVNLFSALSTLDNAPDASVRLTSRAAGTFEDFRKEVHEYAKALDGRERDWWAKAPAQVLRIAGTLAFINFAMNKDANKTAPNKIKEQYITSAVRLVRDYFWPHARAALRQIGLIERKSDARRVLRWLKSNRKTEVSREEIRRVALAQRLDADETDAVLNELARAVAAQVSRAIRTQGGQASGAMGGEPAVTFEKSQ